MGPEYTNFLTVKTAAACNYQKRQVVLAIVKTQNAKLSKLDAIIKNNTISRSPSLKGYVATAVKQVFTRIVLQLLHERYRNSGRESTWTDLDLDTTPRLPLPACFTAMRL